MAFQQYDMSGSLFDNDRKESPNHPDLNGTAIIEGVEYWVSGWYKQGKSGVQFTSLSFKPKEQNGQSRGGGYQQQGRGGYQQQGRSQQRGGHQQQRPPQQQRGTQQGQPRRPAPNFSDMDDDIPF